MNFPVTYYTFCNWLTLYGFVLYIVSMPASSAIMNIGAICALLGMAGTVIFGKKEALVLKFPLFFPLFLFVSWLVISCIISQFPNESWRALTSSWYRVIPMILIGTAAMWYKRSVYIILGVFVFAGFYEGLDGIYQFFTGHDFIKNDPPLGGRLTGSFATYRVGSLMTYLLVPSLVFPFILPEKFSLIKKIAICVFLLFPPLFLLIFSQNRTGMIGFAISLFALIIITQGFFLKKLLGIAVFFSLVFLCSNRFALDYVLHDGRIRELWPLALEIFKEYPVFGSGLYTYSSAFTALGFVPKLHDADILHPHNIYLQLMAETGIVGLIIFLFFVLSTVVWTAKRIRKGLISGVDYNYWLITAGFWSAMVGYLGMGLSGHDLLRSWWFGMAMSIFGITVGACLHLTGIHKPQGQE